MGNWYRNLHKQAFWSTPFSGTDEPLSLRVKTMPEGFMGGEGHTGIYEASDGNHHPNDYFSESDHTAPTEKRLSEQQKKINEIRKKRLKKRKFKAAEYKFALENYDNLSVEELEQFFNILANKKLILTLQNGEKLEATSHKRLNIASYLKVMIYQMQKSSAQFIGQLKNISQEAYASFTQVLNNLKTNYSIDLINKNYSVENPSLKKLTMDDVMFGAPGYASESYSLKKEAQSNEFDKLPIAVLEQFYKTLINKKVNIYLNSGVNLETTSHKRLNIANYIGMLLQIVNNVNAEVIDDLKKIDQKLYELFYSALENMKVKEGIDLINRNFKIENIFNTTMDDVRYGPPVYANMKNKKFAQENIIQPPNENVIEEVLEATITINTENGENGEIGSGFFIGTNICLTCAHVVLPGDQIQGSKISVKFQNKSFLASIWAYDQVLDIAVLVVNDPQFRYDNFLKLGNSSEAKIGDDIILVGTPLGFENVVGKGIISLQPENYAIEQNNRNLMFVSTNMFPGNSGGPVVKTNNKAVVGIASAIIGQEGQGGGLSACIPIDSIKDFLKQYGIKFQFQK